MASVMRREAPWLAIMGGLSLVVLCGAAHFITRPVYTDAYYYFGGALQLARGRGFREPYLWNYLALPPDGAAFVDGGLYPSHLYWMPLASIVAAPFIWLAERVSAAPLSNDALFRAAQLPFLLAAAFLPWLGYAAAMLTTGLRRHAIAAALMTLFSGFYFLYWPTTDAFALYGLSGGGALLFYALAARRWHEPAVGAVGLSPSPAAVYFLAGACAGLAHLARADGILILLCLVALEFGHFVQPWRFGRQPAAGGPMAGPRGGGRRCSCRLLGPLIWLSVGYLLVMFPWFIRNWLVVGVPLPAGGLRTLWLIEYNDIFAYPPTILTAERYFAAGWQTIALGKWMALFGNFQTLFAAQGAVAVFPFIVCGLWKLRGHYLYRPALFYGVALFILQTLGFTFPGMRGGFFHSGTALVPFFFSAAPLGVDVAVEAAARVLRHWRPEMSRPVFEALLTMVTIVMTLALFQQRAVGSDWRNPPSADADEIYVLAGRWLAAAGDTRSIVAVNNPPGFYYHTGHPAIVIPNGGPDVLLQAMADFDARWLVLDVNVPAGLAALYAAPNSDPRLRMRADFGGLYLLERLGE